MDGDERHLAPETGVLLPSQLQGFLERLHAFGELSRRHHDFLLMVDTIDALQLRFLRQCVIHRKQQGYGN